MGPPPTPSLGVTMGGPPAEGPAGTRCAAKVRDSSAASARLTRVMRTSSRGCGSGRAGTRRGGFSPTTRAPYIAHLGYAALAGRDMPRTCRSARCVSPRHCPARFPRSMIRSMCCGSHHDEDGDDDGPTTFPSTERTIAHGILRDLFIAQVLHLVPSWTFVSDESVLADFPEPVETYAERIRDIYGVDVTALPDGFVPTILDAIAERVRRTMP